VGDIDERHQLGANEIVEERAIDEPASAFFNNTFRKDVFERGDRASVKLP
jgi:hypothetical protein